MILVMGMILDALMGEPKWLWDRVPHPAVLMGRAVDWCDQRFNIGKDKRWNGICVVVALVLAALLLGAALSLLPAIAQIAIVAILLAQRSLAQHVGDVADALRLSLHDGQQNVARIVGRDVSALDRSGVARSAIESAAENLSDGVIAPIFWFLLLGLPGLLAYKIINTADSMIGYLNDEYRDFGWAAAKLDDVVNWVPARITAVLITAVTLSPEVWKVVKLDARHHRSPNAGWPEAAMAGALDVALSGPRSYDGQMRDFAFVNADGRHEIGPDDIDAAVRALWKTWGIALGLVALLALIR